MSFLWEKIVVVLCRFDEDQDDSTLDLGVECTRVRVHGVMIRICLKLQLSPSWFCSRASFKHQE